MHMIAKWGTAAVLAHAAVSILHGLAHEQVGVEAFPTLFHRVFILGVITAAPLVAMVLLWTRFRRAGAWLLLASMAGSLLFGVFYHYLAPGPDHATEIPGGAWGAAFHATAFLLVVTEAWGCWVAAAALTRRSAA